MKMVNRGSVKIWIVVLLLALFFAAFLVYPLLHVFKSAFTADEKFTFSVFDNMFHNQIILESIFNSFKIAVVATVFTLLLSVPLSFIFTRLDFPGRKIFSSLLLVPLIMPPFVGAIGMRHLLARFGSINLFLMDLGLMKQPVSWLAGGGFWGIVILEALHLYPIMFLNLSSALANVDPAMEEASKNLGAGKFRMWRTVTIPLMMPGIFAGCSIVFIWAFTDLGTPLVFEYSKVIPVQIFNFISESGTNPLGYALVVLVLALTVLIFGVAKRFMVRGEYSMMARGHTGERAAKTSGIKTMAIYLFAGAVIVAALLPHISVALSSLSRRWFMSVVPSEYTLKFFSTVFKHEMTLTSIRNSISYSFLSTIVDVALGIVIAYLIARKKFFGRGFLDALSMLPLAIPGIILAFGYLTSFIGTPLDAFKNPVALLVISYAVRRLPYIVRSAYAGFQQVSVSLEEASLNLGAGTFRTITKITMPLISANLVAGAVLCFAFAMLEVSDSLVLAVKEQYFPITKAIYQLFGRIEDGPSIACAMGVIGMVLLMSALVAASRLIGRRMGQMFRI